MLGAKSADELIGRDILAFSPPDWRKTTDERVRSIYEDNVQTKRLHMPLLRLDGKTIEIEVTGVPATYHRKPAVQIWIKDMTEIIRAEKKSWDALRYA